MSRAPVKVDNHGTCRCVLRSVAIRAAQPVEHGGSRRGSKMAPPTDVHIYDLDDEAMEAKLEPVC